MSYPLTKLAKNLICNIIERKNLKKTILGCDPSNFSLQDKYSRLGNTLKFKN